MKMRIEKRKLLWAVASTLALSTLFPVWHPPHPARAATGVQLVTPYPGVAVQAGKTVTLNIDVITPSRQRVDLAVTEVPPGWTGTLRGGGFVIQSVFGSPKDADNTPPQVQLEVKVPPDAAQGDFRVAVRGTTAGGSDTLVVALRVSEAAAGIVTLVPEFPSLRGPATETFRFSINLTNNSPEKTVFNLSAEGPEGWRVVARPTTEQRASTVSVDGGASSNIEVEADPADDTTAGNYPVKVHAAGGGKSADSEMSVEITGNVEMTLTTASERLNAKARAGKESRVALVVKNDGTGPLTNIKLTSSPPTGWTVKFSRTTIPEIAPKKSAQVTATIVPAGEAVAGDYAVGISASGEGTTEEVEIRTTIQTSPLWGIFGLLLIAAAVGGLLWVFRRYGRR